MYKCRGGVDEVTKIERPNPTNSSKMSVMFPREPTSENPSVTTEIEDSSTLEKEREDRAQEEGETWPMNTSTF